MAISGTMSLSVGGVGSEYIQGMDVSGGEYVQGMGISGVSMSRGLVCLG